MHKVTPEMFRNRLYEAANIDHKSLRKWLTDTGIGVGNAQTILPHDLNGRNSIPSAEKLAAISAVTGKSVDWLLGLDENAQIQTARARTAAGEHANELAYVFDWFGENTPLTFGLPRKWIAEHIGAEPDKVAACTVHGDAMAPTLNDGDIVLAGPALPLADGKVAAEGLYIVMLDGPVIVRRLQMVGIGRVQMLSDNPLYPPVELRIGLGGDRQRLGGTYPTGVDTQGRPIPEYDRLHLFDLHDSEEYLGFVVGRVEAILSLAK